MRISKMPSRQLGGLSGTCNQDSCCNITVPVIPGTGAVQTGAGDPREGEERDWKGTEMIVIGLFGLFLGAGLII